MERQLRRAVLDQDLPTVRRILQQPGGGFINNVSATDTNGWTALHCAVYRGHLAIVQAILQVEGVNVNVKTVTGKTPLHMVWRASIRDELPIMQALLEAGANPNAANFGGLTPLFYYTIHPCSTSTVEALLAGGANPAVRNNNLDTPLHIACGLQGRFDVAHLLIQRHGSECLTLKNNRGETPLDLLDQKHNEVLEASIGQHILQCYAGMIAQRDGLLSLHSVLQDAAFIDGNDEEYQLPVGKLNTEHLQSLLEYIIAAEPGSVCALGSDGLLPLHVASQLNFPASVLYVLLRPYPDMLFHPSLPSHPQGWLQSASKKVSLICQAAMTLACCNRWTRPN